jgi:hypothetical protein
VVQDEGIALPQRPIMNFTGGGVTATDDIPNNRTNVTVPLGAGVNMPINPDDNNKIAYALAGNFQYTLNLRTDGTSFTSVARTTVGTGAAMTVSAQSALIAGAGANVGASLTVAAGSAANGVASNTGGALNLASGAGATAAGAINVQPGGVTEATFTEGGAFEWAAGIAAPIFRQATLAAAGVAAGTRHAAQSSVVAGGVANTGGQMWIVGGLATQNGTQAATGGEFRAAGGVATQSAAGAVITTGGHAYVSGGAATGFGATGTVVGGNLYLAGGAAAGGATNTPGTVNITSTLVVATADLYWQYDVTAPTLYQQSRIATGAGYPMVYHAQDSLITGGVNQGGALTTRAGDATANLTNNATGGATTVRGGNATCGGGAGSVATGGDLNLSSGTATGAAVANTVGVVNLQTGSVTRLTLAVTATGGDLYWATGIPTAVRIYQADRVTAGSGIPFVLHAQNLTGAVSGTGGALTVYAGDNSCTAGAESGGAATFRAGDVSGASGGANVGGNTTVRAGNATNGLTNTGGDLTLSSGTGATANGSTLLQTGGTTRMGITGAGIINVYVTQLTWVSSASNPTINQDTDATAGVTGDTFSVSAQGCSGTGATTGGAIAVAGGAVTGAGTTITSGAATFRAGDVSGAFTTAGVGGATILRGGNVANVAAKNSTGGKATLAGGDCTGAVAAGTCQGGHVLVRGGIATAASGLLYQGNIAFHADPASWDTLEKGIFIGDCTTQPAGNPASGGYLFSVAGSLWWKGPSGALTQVGAA